MIINYTFFQIIKIFNALLGNYGLLKWIIDFGIDPFSNLKEIVSIWKKIKKYRQDNREHLNKLARIRYEKNKDKMRVYRQQNKVKVNEANKKWQKKKREENCVYKIKCVFRSVVYQSFRRLSLNKPTNTIKLLGCTYEEAKSHMESLFVEGMSWENYGEWHVDHIRPVCSFNETDMHLMNNIHNLQPLWAEDNFKKGSNPSTTYQSGRS